MRAVNPASVLCHKGHQPVTKPQNITPSPSELRGLKISWQFARIASQTSFQYEQFSKKEKADVACDTHAQGELWQRETCLNIKLTKNDANPRPYIIQYETARKNFDVNAFGLEVWTKMRIL